MRESVRSGQRSPPLGTEAGRAWRKEREETSHHCNRTKISCLVASTLGERRSLRTVAQQPGYDRGCSVAKTED